MTHKPEPIVDDLEWFDDKATEIANSLTKQQIDQLRFAFAYHHRNFVKPVSLPTNEKE